MDPQRVVQVIAQGSTGGVRLGSGYLVTRSSVLTAAHVIRDSISVKVRFARGKDQIEEINAGVSWQDLSGDADVAVLALALEIPNDSLDAVEPAPVRYGRIVGTVECDALGFPRFKLTQAEARAGEATRNPLYRDSHHAIGTTTPWSNIRRGTLEISVVPPDPDPDPRHSPWEGMSGAALFSGGCLIGVVSVHHRQEGLRWLAASPVSSWYSSVDPEQFARVRALIRLPEAEQLDVIGPDPGAGAVMALPRDIATFTGRAAELEVLQGVLDEAVERGGALGIYVVDGMAGVGKTAFAVHAAHILAERFPDGQILLELNAHTQGSIAVDPVDGLASLLLGDGLAPRELPAGLQARAELWWRRTADRRMLLVLDDAASGAQIRPLLPTALESLVLVTSRERLSGIDDIAPLSLDVLPVEDAATLFVRVSRLAGLLPEDPDVVRLVQLCGRLPLAIRIVAARLAHHPTWSPRRLIDQFIDAGNRLEAHDRDHIVDIAFDLSYEDLNADQKRLFRFLGARPGNETDPLAAGALMETEPPEAQRLLDDLDDKHLIDEITGSGSRYRVHDLLRDYARSRTDVLPEETESAVNRLLDHYRFGAELAAMFLTSLDRWNNSANAHLYLPAIPDEETARAWLRTERTNLLACFEYAEQRADGPRVVAFSEGLFSLLRTDGPWVRALEILTTALDYSRQIGDRNAEANALAGLGAILRMTGDYPGAVRDLDAALIIYRDLSDLVGEAYVLTHLGDVRQLTGDPDGALEDLRKALRIQRSLGNVLGQANALLWTGSAHESASEFGAALQTWTAALDLYRQAASRLGQANTLTFLGNVKRVTGDFAGAERDLAAALGLHGELGNRLGQTNALTYLGALRRMTGDLSGAQQYFEAALKLHEGLGDKLGQAGALNWLGAIRRMTGDLDGAVDDFTAALALHESLEDRHGRGNSLTQLGIVHFMRGELEMALHDLETALGHFRAIHNPGGEAWALNHYAAVIAAAGNVPRALDTYRQAQQLAAEVEQPDDEAVALEGIAECLIATGETDAAVGYLRHSLQIFQHLAMHQDAERLQMRIAELFAGGEA